jgi:tetratricopeptide (TPR) repeat protein
VMVIGVAAMMAICAQMLYANWCRDRDKFVEQGVALLKEDKPQDAILHFSAAIKMAPDYGHAYLCRGLAYGEIGETQKAIWDLHVSNKFGESKSRVLVSMASVEEQAKHYDNAIDFCTSVILDEPNNAEAYEVRAACQAQRLQFGRAISDCTRALNLTDNTDLRVRLFQQRALAEAQTDQTAAALEDITKAIKIKPSEALYLKRGDLNRSEQRFTMALSDYSQALRLNSKSYCAYVGCGICAAAVKQPHRALEDFSSALQLNSRGVEALIQRGSLYLDQGDFDHAMTDLQMAHDLNPYVKETQDKLSIAARKLKESAHSGSAHQLIAEVN